ncbi:beta-klotho-like [Sinocyclocheilus rhinocerous]|uniref:beta-klotho-like n=1 Tax=Sinocyclocheilus rhinocerous TaxID=307959 RepID=UPI0007B942B7|nr:PREDICTED: beta-klotho-like [Sinocyclocheilus rhinocerous]
MSEKVQGKASKLWLQQLNETFLQTGVFPSRFLWGVGTAAFPTEGSWDADGKGESVWDRFTRHSDPSSDSYIQWEEDLESVQYLGVNFYAFSLSWTRIFPDGNAKAHPNPAGVQHYRRLIGKLKELQVEPVVTLFHWDLPQVLQERFGGWLNRSTADVFADYAAFCFRTFGAEVRYWITMHNPFLLAVQGYGTGAHAPGVTGDPADPFIAAHNLLRAHAKAWHVYDKHFRPHQHGKVSITLGSHWVEPLHAQATPTNLELCQKAMEAVIGWFAEPIYGSGDYPESLKASHRGVIPEFSAQERLWMKGTADFFSLAFGRETQRVGQGLARFGQTVKLDLRSVLVWVQQTYGDPQVLVAESGWFSDASVGVEDTVAIYLMKRFIMQVMQDYAAFCFRTFGAEVRYWITMHNPFLLAVQGYGTGAHAPGVTGDPADPFIAAHNLLRAHAKAWHVYDKHFRPHQHGKVSITLGSHWVEPLHAQATPTNLELCQKAMEAVIGWFAEPIYGSGDYPESLKASHRGVIPEFSAQERLWMKGTADFFSLAFGRETQRVGQGLARFGQTVKLDLRSVLVWVQQTYGDPQVLVAESGWFSDASVGVEDTVAIYLMKRFIMQVHLRPFSPQFTDPQLYRWNVSGDGALTRVTEVLLHTQPAQCTDFLFIQKHLFLLGVTGSSHYRFALDWMQLAPGGDPEKVRFYRCVLMELQRRGIRPVVTLYHPSYRSPSLGLPEPLHANGGWRNASAVEAFVSYAVFCYREFGALVSTWITINEPNRLNEAYAEEWQTVTRHLQLAHAKAWHIYDAQFRRKQGGAVSLALHADWVEPANPFLESHKSAQQQFLEFELGRFLDPLIGGGNEGRGNTSDDERAELKGALDFVALNHFTTRLVLPWKQPTPLNQEHGCALMTDATWKVSHLGQALVPWGLRRMLGWVRNRYGDRLPIIITATGVDDQAVHDDQLRQSYIRSYLQEALKGERSLNIRVLGPYFNDLMV